MMAANVEIANPEQATAWDGHEGDNWTQHADHYDRAGRRRWARFLDTGLVTERDAVLDIGCGTGRSTRDVAGIASQGSALGIDLSARMLQLARQRSVAEGLRNVTFAQGDAQVYPFATEHFDIAISSFGAMFFNDPVAAFSNVARATRPGGRLALLVFRELQRNDWLMALREALAAGRELPFPPPDAPTPFSFADPERVRGILGAAGYADVNFTPMNDPMDLGADPADAYAFALTIGIVEDWLRGLDDHAREQALLRLQATLAAHATADGVLLGSAAWLITARRS